MCVIIRCSRSSNKARDIWRAPLLPPPSPLLRPGCEEAASALRVLYKMLHLTLLPSLCTHIRIDRGALHAMRLCSRNNNTHTHIRRQAMHLECTQRDLRGSLAATSARRGSRRQDLSSTHVIRQRSACTQFTRRTSSPLPPRPRSSPRTPP